MVERQNIIEITSSEVNNKIKKRLVYFMLLIMALSGSSCVIQNATPSPTPFPSNRKVISDTLALQEKWRVKSGTIVEDTLHWTKNGLVYADYTQQLVLLDNQNGQTLWQTEYSQFFLR